MKIEKERICCIPPPEEIWRCFSFLAIGGQPEDRNLPLVAFSSAAVVYRVCFFYDCCIITLMRYNVRNILLVDTWYAGTWYDIPVHLLATLFFYNAMLHCATLLLPQFQQYVIGCGQVAVLRPTLVLLYVHWYYYYY